MQVVDDRPFVPYVKPAITGAILLRIVVEVVALGAGVVKLVAGDAVAAGAAVSVVGGVADLLPLDPHAVSVTPSRTVRTTRRIALSSLCRLPTYEDLERDAGSSHSGRAASFQANDDRIRPEEERRPGSAGGRRLEEGLV